MTIVIVILLVLILFAVASKKFWWNLLLILGGLWLLGAIAKDFDENSGVAVLTFAVVMLGIYGFGKWMGWGGRDTPLPPPPERS